MINNLKQNRTLVHHMFSAPHQPSANCKDFCNNTPPISHMSWNQYWCWLRLEIFGPFGNRNFIEKPK